MKPIAVDFETAAIEPRPDYPPVPVGVAIYGPGDEPFYVDWGHPGSLAHNREYAERLLREAWDHPGGVVFHNAKFDLAVAKAHFGLEPPRIVHDTMIELFLSDPHQPDLHLKSASERLLGMLPEEQDAVADWLIAHQPVEGKRVTKGNFGAYISLAPASVVAPYAIGDVERTARLHDLLNPGMNGAYEREIKLLRILLKMEDKGIRVNQEALEADATRAMASVYIVEDWLRRELRSPNLNLDSAAELVEALDARGMIDRLALPRTKTGRESTKKDALHAAVTDRTMLAVLRYRREMLTCLRTFMQPWLVMAEKSGGLIYTNWHQTRGEDGGARTGRLSSSPNFQNIPKEFKPIFDHEAPGRGLVRSPIEGLVSIPNVRKFIVPSPGCVLIGRDYSQQEPRILAHFEDGQLLEEYRNDPWFDVYDGTTRRIRATTGRDFERKPVKITWLGLMYGMGVGKLAMAVGCTVEVAVALKEAILQAYPGVRELQDDLKGRARNRLPIRTWGGRAYFCEPAKLVDGVMRSFEYKLLNILIQGSAADCTKEAVIRYDGEYVGTMDHRLLLTVHDELLCECPFDQVEEGQEALKHAMESVEFDVPMLSEGYVSSTNWAEIAEYDKKGVRCGRS